MKKITLFLFVLFSSWQVNAQFGCGSAVVITNGYTATGITTPGSGGLEDWNTNPTGTTINGSYWNDDVYLFQYTAGAASEEISMTIISVNPWNGIGIFSACTGTTFSGQLSAVGSSTTSNATQTVATTIAPFQTIYIAVGQWGAPNGLNFSVTNFSAIPLVNPPPCTSVISPANGAINVSSNIIRWTAPGGAPTGYNLNVGTLSGQTDVLNNFPVGNVLSYDLGNLDASTTYFVRVIPNNSYGNAPGVCPETNFTTCDVIAPEFVEPFNTFLPACWSNMSGGDLVTGPILTTGSRWIVDGFANVGNTGAIRTNVWNTGNNSWVVSPVIDLPSSGYELKFDAAATQDGTVNAPTNAWEADDVIQVLVSSTGTANWTVLHTYNNTNQPSITGTSLIIDLDAYVGQQVRFAFRALEGAINDAADIDFFIDNFEVRFTPSTVPNCVTNLVAVPNATCGNKPTIISWDAASGANGYTLSIGTIAGGPYTDINVGNATTYPFLGLIGATYYYKIVAFNAAGPANGCVEKTYTTVANGCYCDSVPTSNDFSGISNVVVGATNFPNGDVFYFNHTATVVDVLQSLSTNVQITFATSYSYTTHIWIDLNDDYNFDSSELVYSGVSLDANPTTLNASFVMPATAPLGQHRMRIGTADSGQDIPNPCYSGSYGVTLDFMVNVVAASCVPPTATATIIPDCVNNQYFVNVNVTSLGNGSPKISYGTTSLPVSSTGVISVGPFANGSTNVLTLLHGVDAICNIPLGSFNYICPPVNDDCLNATAATMPYNNSQNASSATNNAGFITACGSGANDGVWYTVVGNGGNITVAITNLVGWDGRISVYTGACGTFNCVGTVDVSIGDETYIITNSVVGTTYYINIGQYSGTTNNPEGPFTIDITTTLSSNSFDNESFIAYPNPVKDVFNLSYPSEISSVRVLNLLGQEVVSKTVNATSTQVDMSHLSAGTYIVNVTVGTLVKSIKVIKQ